MAAGSASGQPHLGKRGRVRLTRQDRGADVGARVYLGLIWNVLVCGSDQSVVGLSFTGNGASRCGCGRALRLGRRSRGGIPDGVAIVARESWIHTSVPGGAVSRPTVAYRAAVRDASTNEGGVFWSNRRPLADAGLDQQTRVRRDSRIPLPQLGFSTLSTQGRWTNSDESGRVNNLVAALTCENMLIVQRCR